MDGPNVNLKLHDLLEKELFGDDDDAMKLINVGTCGLHTVHNSFKAGCTQSEWPVGDLLSSLYYLFADAPARREDFIKITRSDTFPLKFCKHRWLENVPIITRVQEIWGKVETYIAKVQTDKTFTQPHSKSYEVVKEAVLEPLMPAKMATFESIAKQLLPFLTIFQSDKPLLPFVCGQLEKLLRGLLKIFIKPEVLTRASTGVKLINVEASNNGNWVDVSKIDVGFIAQKHVQTLLASKKTSDRQVYEFRVQCRSFLIAVVNKIVEKSPINYSFAKNMVCLDPTFLIDNREASLAKFKGLLNKLVLNKRVAMRDCDLLLQEYSDFVDRAAGPMAKSFKEFNFKHDRLDQFYAEHIDTNTKLWPLIRKLLVLSHGQASVERGFSVNRQILVENLKERSFIAQRTIHDHLISVGGLAKIDITKPLLSAAAAGRQKYAAYLDEQKRENNKLLEQKKRKALNDQIDDIKAKSTKLSDDIHCLEYDADKSAEKAETTNNMFFITKSNALRRSAKEKKGDPEQTEGRFPRTKQ